MKKLLFLSFFGLFLLACTTDEGDGAPFVTDVVMPPVIAAIRARRRGDRFGQRIRSRRRHHAAHRVAPDQRGDQRSLSRSGVSVQDKNPILRIAAEEPAEAIDRIFLRGSWLECEILVNLGGDMFC